MTHRLYCDACHWSRYTDGSDLDDLIAYKRGSVQSSIPKLDEKSKITSCKSFKLPRSFKCPQCGRLVTPKKIKEKEN